MKHVVVSVHDSASGLFGRPVFVAAAGQAVRSFADEVNSDKGDLANHAEDFTLYKLGEFDDASGQFSSEGATVLARGKDLKQVTE